MTSEPDTPVSEDELHAFVDRRLDAGREADLRAHLDAHPEIAEEVESWRANEAALSELLSAHAYSGPEDIPTRGRSWWSGWASMAVAILVAFALGGGAGFFAHGAFVAPAAAQPGWLEAAARDVFLTYVREVRHPVEVGVSEREHLVNWLGNRIENPFTAPSLEDLGFALVGGRLLPLGGRPGAMLMYENAQGDRATILLARNSGARDTAFQFSQDEGVNTFRWIDGPLAYAISGFLERGALEDISRAVYAHFETI